MAETGQNGSTEVRGASAEGGSSAQGAEPGATSGQPGEPSAPPELRDSVLERLIYPLVHALRRLAVLLNAPVERNLPEKSWSRRVGIFLVPTGYPPAVMLLATLILAGLVFGADAHALAFFLLGAEIALEPEARVPAVVLAIIGLLALCVVNFAANASSMVRSRLLVSQLVVLFLVSLVIFLSSVPSLGAIPTLKFFSEIPTTIGHVALLVLALCLAICSLPALALFPGRYAEEVHRRLSQTELFRPRTRYPANTAWSYLWTLFAKLLTNLPQLFFPSALFYLMSPDDSIWQWWTLLPFGFTFVLFAINAGDDRLDDISDLLNGLFFRGPQLLISLVVLVVAFLRWRENHYIGYLFNLGDSDLSNPNLIAYFFFAYVLAWFYDFWSAHFMSRRVIRLLAGKTDGPPPTTIAYHYTGTPGISAAKTENRVIRLHGADHFEVEGDYSDGVVRKENLRIRHFLSPRELMLALWQRYDDRERPAPDVHLSRSPFRELHHATRIYPVLCTIIAVVVIFLVGAIVVRGTLQPPQLALHYPRQERQEEIGAGLIKSEGELRATNAGGRPRLVDLAGLLGTDVRRTDPCYEQLASGAPRIAIAGSGGGTRAAMFTASVLTGLAEHDRVCNVVLASGVSGGSAALGYFAIHAGELRIPGSISAKAKPWTDFLDVMARPFIQDVIKAASAHRISFGANSWIARICQEPDQNSNFGNAWSRWPLSRSRLGQLLGERFACEMGGAAIGGVPFVLMLNTSLLGRFSTAGVDCGEEEMSLPARIRACKSLLLGDGVGGRLVISNREGEPLSEAAVQPSDPCPPAGGIRAAPADPAAALRYTSDPASKDRAMDIVEIAIPSVPIGRAAALSANFPPVFPDAPIDISCRDHAQHGTRYWVTDGGAVENRGTLTMLLAIEQAIAALKKASHGTLDRETLMPLHIVIADVSRDPGNYEESLGFNSVLNAGSQLGLQLEAEIIDRIAETYQSAGQTLRVHEIQMPPVFRNGGIGTHWMIPATLTFTEPAGYRAWMLQNPAQGNGAPPRQGNTKLEEIEVSPAGVRAAIRSLHSSGPISLDENAKKLVLWAREDPKASHDSAWRNLLCWLDADPIASAGKTTCETVGEFRGEAQSP